MLFRSTGLRIREVIVPFGTVFTNGNQVGFQFDLLTNNQSVVILFKSQSTASAIYTNVVRVGSAQFDPDLFNNLVLAEGRVVGVKDRTLSGELSALERRLVVSWPATALPLRLETTADLVPPLLWLPLTNGIARMDGMFVFTNLGQGRERYFRLVLP